MPIAPKLQRFVDDELARSAGLIERAQTGTLQLLRDGGGLTPAEREHHFAIVEALQRQGARYQARFGEALREAVLRELSEAHDGAVAAGGGLELMDESRVEVDIEISRAMQIIDSTAEWELRELQTFTSTLAGQQHVSAESNPLRPLAFATALWEAACTVVPGQAQRATLLRVSAGVMAGLLKTAWAAASSRLEAQGIEPGIYKTVILANTGVPPRPPGAAAAVPGGPGALLGGGAVAAGPVIGAAPADEARVADLLSRLFTLIQADTELPSACRALMARLQVAALRVALQDPAMLDAAEHPVWQLMNRMASACMGYPAAGDRRLATLLAFCEAVSEEISRTPTVDTTAFRRGLARLDAFLAEQLQWQRREAESTVAALQRAERRELLEQVLSQRLAEQMAAVRCSAPIRRFVTGAWAKVLAESMTQFGEQVEPTPSYLKTVDDLLWSLQTPDHPQSRQRLLGLLPGLLQRLRAGMALIAMPGAEQQAVLDELMAVHTEALRPQGRGAAPALTPQEIVQRMRDEVIPEAPAQRPFADSVIDLASMDTVPADFLATNTMGAATVEESARRLDGFTPGDRQRLFLQGRWSRVQLLWRSDQGQYFLYAGERPGQTHSITRRALERLDTAALVRPLESKPLVARSIEALMNQLALPA